MTATVLLVEDDKAIQLVVEMLLSTEPDLELVGTVDTAEAGVELTGRLRPDVVLLDNQLAGPLSGLAAAPELKLVSPRSLVLLCTALDLRAAADAEPAIDGYLRKDELAALVDAVRDLLARGGQPGSA